MQIKSRRFITWDDFKSSYSLFLPQAAQFPNKPLFSNYLFRGQGDADWELISSFDRIVPSTIMNPASEFQKWLRFFISMSQHTEGGGAAIFRDNLLSGNADPAVHQEQVAMAQHYGVPTRYLDWSLSPYKAAFFAFFDTLQSPASNRKDIAIWAVNLKTFRLAAPQGFSFLNVRWNSSARVRNQLGRFMENSSRYPTIEQYINKENQALADSFMKFQIPAAEAKVALNDLLMMGISPVDIYPDFEGVAKYVRLRQLLEGYRI